MPAARARADERISAHPVLRVFDLVVIAPSRT
jgi:hypothetical protein